MSELNNGPTLTPQQFYTQFNLLRDDLQSKIDGIASVTDRSSCIKEHTALTGICKSALMQLPSHDHKIYTDELKILLERINKMQINGPRKFTFSTRKGQSTTPNVNKVLSTSDISPLSRSETEDKLSVVRKIRKTKTEGNSTVYENISGKSVAEEVVVMGSRSQPGDVKLKNLDHTIIKLDKHFATGELQNITRSLVYIKSIDGPIYMTEIVDSIIIVSCHQFRLHQSENVDAYLSCGSKRPIIENCRAIRFAQFPVTLASQNQLQNIVKWDTVDDFNWLKKEKSANWCTLPVDSDSRDWNYILGDLPDGVNKLGFSALRQLDQTLEQMK